MNYEYLAGKGFDNYRKTLNDPESLIWYKIEETVKKFAPSIVGITTKSQNYAAACNVAKIVKSVNNNTLVVFGGPHATLIKGELLNNPAIDIGVLREGEETLVEILDAFEGSKPLSAIKGIVYREGDNIFETQRREFIDDLDSLPFPVTVAQDCLIDFDKYPRKSFKYIFAIRGCPFSCSFCGSRYTWSRKVRFRSVENIIEEIREIQRLGIDDIHFDDDTWGIKKSFIQNLCIAIKEQCPGLRWSCEIHVKFVDDETISFMKSAGCHSIQIGVESGNNEILKLLNKNSTIEDVFAAANIIKKHNIHLQTFFIVGFPQETEETLHDTISAMTSIPADFLIYSIFTPYYGTKLFNHCKELGIIVDDFDISLFNHQSPENYFCPNIPKDEFKECIRELEKTVDRINNRNKLKYYFSREGYRKFKEKGFKYTMLKMLRIVFGS